MSLKQFIESHGAEIVAEWERFAGTMAPAAGKMDGLALRDHAQQILNAIGRDIETEQSGAEQTAKSQGLSTDFRAVHTAAAIHGELRLTAGFDLRQLFAEFRALRATVLRLWGEDWRGHGPGEAVELTRFNEAVDQALAESVAAYSDGITKSRDTFLAILGHDLGRPLNALEGRIAELSQENSPAERSGKALLARGDLATLKAMVRDLLEYTRTRLGRGVPVNPSRSDLALVCKNALNDVSFVYPQASFRFESGGDLVGMFDPVRMRQVVANLLNNAVQHGDKGAPVSLIARRVGDQLTVEVQNQGEPMRDEDLQCAFEPLVTDTMEASAVRRSASVGLGLFVAREVVTSHGGTIRASSSGRTTSFAFEIPRTVSATNYQAEWNEFDSQSSRPNARGAVKRGVPVPASASL